MQLTLENVTKIIKEEKSSGHGVTSMFYKITPKIGLKVIYGDFHSDCGNLESHRDEIYERQKLAAKYGLGPAVYGKIELEIDGEIRYGYLTEIVVIKRGSYKKKTNFINYHEDHIALLRSELKEKTGFYFFDCHSSNVGIKKKKLVCIDFGS